MSGAPTFKFLKGRTLHRLHSRHGIVRLLRECLMRVCKDLQYELQSEATARRFENELKDALDKLRADRMIDGYILGPAVFVRASLHCSIQVTTPNSNQVQVFEFSFGPE